jgi:hypothetical protein
MNIPDRLYKAIASPKISTTRGRYSFYPSGASIKTENGVLGSCHRQEYYSFFGYKRTGEIVPQWTLAARMGDSLHETVTQLLNTYQKETEITVLRSEQGFYEPEHKISGRIDLLLYDNASQEVFGCDIKTVGEWKCGQVITEPSIDHILQCAVYLYVYQKQVPKDSKKIKEWIILYLARNETYKTKRRQHGSLFEYMWQFSIYFENGHVVCRSQNNVVKHYNDITIEGILSRYKELFEKVKTRTLPDREFEAQYSEETITGLYRSDKLPTKKMAEHVKKWLDKGAPKGELKLEHGDSACRFCDYRDKCYSKDPETLEKSEEVLYDIPEDSQILVISDPEKMDTANYI